MVIILDCYVCGSKCHKSRRVAVLERVLEGSGLFYLTFPFIHEDWRRVADLRPGSREDSNTYWNRGQFLYFHCCKSTIKAHFTKRKENSVAIKLFGSEMCCFKENTLPITGNIPTKVAWHLTGMLWNQQLTTLFKIYLIYRLIWLHHNS